MIPDQPPRVSILVPNFNNSRASSKDGVTDLIGDLLESLHATLRDDKTPLEILICDDGSTDDSLETCREWSQRTWGGSGSRSGGGWRGEQPFLRLIEREHCGVLSITANILTRESQGDICVRLDGDITCDSPNWAEKLVRVFDESPPKLGVVGPKQLGIDGRIHSAGDWILHPRGNHHIASGALRDAVMTSIECDHVMGCFYCYKREVFDELCGYDENFLRGQTVDFGLRARLKGWRCISVPHIEFTHRHALRAPRSTEADTDGGIEKTLDIFETKWGFNRIAPDLDVVREKYAGTPLLWNPRIFGPRIEWPPVSQMPAVIENTEWQRFATDSDFQGFIQSRMAIAREIGRNLPDCKRILHWFSRAGLFAHLLAGEGWDVTGIDPDSHLVALATEITARQQYESRPRFITQDQAAHAPLDDASVDLVLLFDAIERHHNPVGLFHEAHRVLSENGVLAIVSQMRPSPFERDADGLHCYRRHELKLQLESTSKFREFGKTEESSGGNLIIMLARRIPARACDLAQNAEPQLALNAG